MTVRIAYMGIPFSNSEEAAATFARQHGWTETELLPLISSAGVIGALDRNDADFGVVAVSNIAAGPVSETREALRGRQDIITLDTVTVPIHHCIFIRRESCQINTLVSHPQALMQTAKHLLKIYPDTERLECADTALAAQYLADGTYPDTYAVVCRRNAGEHYGLWLAYENVEDRPDNMTSFDLLQLRR